MEFTSVVEAAKHLRCVMGAAILMVLGSCALVPQEAVLNPSVTANKIVAGRNAAVVLEVVDERPSTLVGTRMMGQANRVGAEINVADMAPMVETKAKDALVKNEFVPLGASAAAEKKLKIEVRLLELKTSHSLFSASYLPATTLKAVARNKGEEFEKLYRADFSEGTAWANSDEKNNRLLSEIVAKALGEMLNDPALMGFLAR